MFRIELRPWTSARGLATPIRFAVFVEEQHVPEDVELDTLDASSLHALAWHGSDEVIGTGRLLPAETHGQRRVGHVGRMAVLAPWRGQGAGGAILRVLLETAARRGDHVIELAAQVHAIGFYRAHGFVEQGEEFLEAGIVHRTMHRVLHA